MIVAKVDQLRGELEQPLLRFIEIPVEPGDLVVLAVAVVIAVLRARELVAASSIGTPCDSISVARKLRIWRSRSSLMTGSSVGPSAPMFQESLLSAPSLLLSPLASLCFSL